MEKSEESASEAPSPRARADRRATGIVVAVFLVVSAAFIVDSTWELAKGAFELDGHEALGTSAEATACYAEVRALESDVDRALVEAAKVKVDDAEATFASALGPRFADAKLHEVEETCRTVPRGLAAYGAILRIRRAEETQLHERTTEVSPPRGDLARALAK